MNFEGKPAGGGRLAGWRVPMDNEVEAGIAALAEAIGPDEAKKPSWQRRLVVAKENGEWLLIVNEALFISRGDALWTTPFHVPGALTSIPCAFSISMGVELLASDASPERELARRQVLVDQHAKMVKEREEVALRKIEAEAAAATAWARDRIAFRESIWLQLAPWQRGFFALAVALTEHHPDIAYHLRRVASCDNPGLPRTKWWSS
jgi:hypothetical protein